MGVRLPLVVFCQEKSLATLGRLRISANHWSAHRLWSTSSALGLAEPELNQQRTIFSETRPRVAFRESTTNCDSSTMRA